MPWPPTEEPMGNNSFGGGCFSYSPSLPRPGGGRGEACARSNGNLDPRFVAHPTQSNPLANGPAPTVFLKKKAMSYPSDLRYVVQECVSTDEYTTRATLVKKETIGIVCALYGPHTLFPAPSLLPRLGVMHLPPVEKC